MNIIPIITFIHPQDGQKLYQPKEYKQRGTIGLKLIRQVMSHPIATCVSSRCFRRSVYLYPNHSPHSRDPIFPSISQICHRSMLSPSLPTIYQFIHSIIYCACSCVLLRMLHGTCPCIRQVFDELSASTLGFWLVEGQTWAFRHLGGDPGHFHSTTVCVMSVHLTSCAVACICACTWMQCVQSIIRIAYTCPHTYPCPQEL